MLKTARGFTLVELIATIAIAAVLTVMAGTFIGDYVQWTRKTANEYTLGILNGALTRYVTLGGIRDAHSLGGLNTQAKVAAVIGALRTGLTVGGTRTPFISPRDSVVASQTYVTGAGKEFIFCGYGQTLSSESSQSVAGTYVPAEVASMNLSSLALFDPIEDNYCSLSPAFSGAVTSYSTTIPWESATYVARATTVTPGALLEIQGGAATSGANYSTPLMGGGTHVVSVKVTDPGDANNFKVYTITVTTE